MIENSFVTPPLFTILCVFLGAAIFFAPYSWLFKRTSSSISLGVYVFTTAMYAFFGVALFSCLHGVYDGRGLLWPEIFVLLILGAGGFLYAKITGQAPKDIPARLIHAFFVNNALAVGFILLSGGLIMLLLFFLPLEHAVFSTGVVFIGALYWLYGRYNASEDIQFHQILWPLVLGLLLFMGPLLVQEIANSEEFQKSLHAAPRLQKA